MADFDLIAFLCLFSGGKRNENLILPINDSISGTLSTNEVNETKQTLETEQTVESHSNETFIFPFSYVQKPQS